MKNKVFLFFGLFMLNCLACTNVFSQYVPFQTAHYKGLTADTLYSPTGGHPNYTPRSYRRATIYYDTVYKVFRKYFAADQHWGYLGIDTVTTVNDSTLRFYQSYAGNVFFDIPVPGSGGGGTITDDVTWSVIDILNTPPISPNTNDAYLINTSPTGAWSGHANEIATYNGSSWDFDAAITGNILNNSDNDFSGDFGNYKFNGSTWDFITRRPLNDGGNNSAGAVRGGTIGSNAFTLITNNTARLTIGASGSITFKSLTGSGNALMNLDATGLASRINASNGYLKNSGGTWSFDNSTFQTQLNGTGFVKASGTTISYDNSTYVPATRSLTINGESHDLSANASWTVSGGGGMSIGGDITSATQGSVLFAGTGGKMQQSNSNFYYDSTNKKLGIAAGTSLTHNIDVGTSSAGGNQQIWSTLGTEQAAALTAGNWTLGTGWENPIVGTGLNKNADGTGTATPSATTTITAYTSYKIVFTVTGLTSGTFQYSIGGINSSTISANGTYTDYVTTWTTTKIVITPTNTSRFVISVLSIKPLSNVSSTGNLIAEGNSLMGGNFSVIGQKLGIGINLSNTGISTINGISMLGNTTGISLSHDNTYWTTFQTGSSGAFSLSSNAGGKFTDNMFTTFGAGFSMGSSYGYNFSVAPGETVVSDASSFLGSGGTDYRVVQAANNGTATTNHAYGSIVLTSNKITKASSGTHPLFTNFGVLGLNIASGSAALTDAASVYIKAAATGTGAPTGVHNMSLWVDDGISRFDGSIVGGKGIDVASANDLTLGTDGNTFLITGTTTINAITTSNWLAGSHITLIFQSNPTVKNNTAGGAGTAIMFLAGGVDFSATSNDVLKLVYDGTEWVEEGRSIN